MGVLAGGCIGRQSEQSFALWTWCIDFCMPSLYNNLKLNAEAVLLQVVGIMCKRWFVILSYPVTQRERLRYHLNSVMVTERVTDSVPLLLTSIDRGWLHFHRSSLQLIHDCTESSCEYQEKFHLALSILSEWVMNMKEERNSLWNYR